MRKHKRRHLSPAGFLLALILLIAIIFAIDAIYRTFFQACEENIIGVGGFATAGSASGAETNSSDDTTGNDANATEADTEATTDPNALVLQLTATDMANGSLIQVDAAHPYAGTQTMTDFSAITDSYVNVKSTDMPIQSEIQEDLCAMFDDYAAANGWANLQIYSTTDATLDSSSIYTNSLPDRSTGYGFDIGLITSTGEVVPYITKRNEWMVTNSWEYGFILRYPSDKTETTGIDYAPHHFRYVGKVHAAIMHENDFCLEEYLAYLQSYTMDSGGLSYTDGTNSWQIYYIPADASGTTTVQLTKDTVYTISGDNQSGFILTVSTDNAVSSEATTDAT